MPRPALTPKDREALNRELRSIQAILADARKAESAGIPGADKIVEDCVTCQSRIEALKAAYFPMLD